MAMTSMSVATPATARETDMVTSPSVIWAGCRPRTGRGLSKTETAPWFSSSPRTSSRLSRSRPSDIQNVSKSPSNSVTHSVTESSSGANALGRRLGRRCWTACASWKTNPSGGRSVKLTRAAGRPSRAAWDSAASMRSMRRGQSRADAHVPSVTISSGPRPTMRSCGFNTGPAKAAITAATATRRSNNSHHGVRSVWLSSSVRSSNNATPGKRRLIGAGGTARSKIHRIGSTINPSKSQGAVKAMGPIFSIRFCAPTR